MQLDLGMYVQMCEKREHTHVRISNDIMHHLKLKKKKRYYYQCYYYHTTACFSRNSQHNKGKFHQKFGIKQHYPAVGTQGTQPEEISAQTVITERVNNAIYSVRADACATYVACHRDTRARDRDCSHRAGRYVHVTIAQATHAFRSTDAGMQVPASIKARPNCHAVVTFAE